MQARNFRSGPSSPQTGDDDTLRLAICTPSNATRTSQYDSFRRLVQAVNPENGTITYQYDASGNLARRADGARTVSLDAYDGLNRVTRKSYNDGITSAVTYGYGDKVYSSCQNQGGGVCGRLISVTATPLSGPVIVNSYSSFDPMISDDLRQRDPGLCRRQYGRHLLCSPGRHRQFNAA